MPEFDESSMGRHIKRIRLEKGLTQQQVSTASGIQNTVISAYENSQKTPGLSSLIKLSQAMNVSLDELVFGSVAEKTINSSKDDAELIVHCIYELWKRGMIYPPYELKHVFSTYGDLPYVNLSGIWQFRYQFVIDRLLEQLDDHREKEETYSQPEKHIEQILESAIFEIKKDIK